MLPFRAAVLIFLLATVPLVAQERPYFVAYSHEMEDPGDLEIESVERRRSIGRDQYVPRIKP